jgi:CspA family cold shock protein
MIDGSVSKMSVLPEQGTVKWFNQQKGYGFITPDKGGADVFLHISELQKNGIPNVLEGERVEYEIERSRKTGRFAAANVRKIDGVEVKGCVNHAIS